jgi:Tfp pilus assembly protein PilV
MIRPAHHVAPWMTARLRHEGGFTIVEVLLALLVLTVGILGMFTAFTASQKLSLVSERHASMLDVAQKEIERLEGIAYSQIGLTSSPSRSTDPRNPDYYVQAGSPANFEWDRTAGSSEQLDVDTTAGTVVPVQNWSEGQVSGQIYDFVTWTADPKCAPGCPSSQDYKRVTVAITMAGSLQPNPVYESSVIADPSAAPAGGTVNGSSGNPLINPATTCTNSSQQQVACTSMIDSGNPNTYFLHDWAATNTGTPPLPSANNATHPTVGTVSGGTCTPSNTSGCPVPDLMDSNPPSTGTSGSQPPLYNYSTDQGTSGFPGGRLLQPTCSSGTGCGTASTSDCSNGKFTSSLVNVQSELWVTPPLTTTTTLTGDGGVSLSTQTLNGVPAVVSLCVEIYDVPPSNGSSGSLADILAWPPVDLGGAAYVPPTDPSTGSNWPTSANQVSFIFNFRGSNGAVSIASGHRIGFRIWEKAESNTPIDAIYDNPLYPAQVQLNTQ